MAQAGFSIGHVLLLPRSAVPPLSPPVSAVLGWGTLPPENPTLGWRNLSLFCTKISQRQKTPSAPHPVFSFPRIRALALSHVTLSSSEALAEQAEIYVGS